MNILLGSLGLLLVLVPLAAAPQVPGPAARSGGESAVADQEFRDQDGHVDSLARHAGSPVVAVIVSVKGLAMIEKWERDLDQRVPGVRFLNVADFPANVPFDLERAALTLRKRVPPGVPVLMDPSRQWATAFGLDTAVPNLLLFDAAGGLTARFRGRWSPGLAAEVAAAIPREPVP
jgi:hypothetical protein